ncbi:hypothetical protein [uncultured Campylobacter sp.]|uniref:hypothetical protein n=1 Tax=uncultured Campylobacter sp. TaxID=218934 RepID=UPI00261B7741|nr:hypothetical protein [uncultured Campylobacter sp.]
MKILSLIAAVGHFSHGGKAEKTSAVRVFAMQAPVSRSYIGSEIDPPKYMKLRRRAA